MSHTSTQVYTTTNRDTVVPQGTANGIYMPDSEPATIQKKEFSVFSLLQDAASCDTGIKIWNPSRTDAFVQNLSYKQLLSVSISNKLSIQRAAWKHGNTTILMHFDDHKHNIEIFWSIVAAGCIPVVSTPLSTSSEQRVQHLEHLKNRLDDPLCITTKKLLSQYPELGQLSTFTVEQLERDNDASSQKPKTSNDLSQVAADPMTNPVRPAALMLTSGSTGNCKVVPLMASKMLASVKGKSKSLGTTGKSKFLNWIGFDHVANLLEIHLQAMYLKTEQVHIHAGDLIADPIRFVRIIDQYRITNSFAPNFFLAMLEKDLKETVAGEGLSQSVDLSCLETIVTGGEANLVETAKNVDELLQKLGAKKHTLVSAYGLTEACAGMSYVRLDPEYEASEQHEFCSIGKPTFAAKMRIVKTDGAGLAEPYEFGLLELSGDVVFEDYYNDREATEGAFSADGWFMTGDRGFIDKYGMFNLAGRKKEVVLINGVKYAPHDLESVLDRAKLPYAVPSYFAVFSFREEFSSTEEYCVVYGLPTSDAAREKQLNTSERIAKTCSDLVGARPHSVLPIDVGQLVKSSLGKLSRSKLRSQFESGRFDYLKIRCRHPLDLYRRETPPRPPITPSQVKVVRTLSDMLELPAELISIDQTVFELGITSISLFRFEKLLRRQFEHIEGISIINFLSNPVIEAIANAIDHESSGEYDPVAQLQVHGNKTPLWLVHPASGNVLAFLPLAREMRDRPLYAVTARGLRRGEETFHTLDEMASTYHKHIKLTQNQGPYAIMGYSLGSSVAFEVAKRLEAGGDEVKFCGALDSPPHIAPLVGHLDWTHAAVLVTFFLDLLPQTDVPEWTERLKDVPQKETAERLLDLAKENKMDSLNLDADQLLAIINIAYSFGIAANEYEPIGHVSRMDVFWCTPLHSVEKSREKWINEYLVHWREHSRSEVCYYECDGDHADMINPTHVTAFKERLDKVLAERGL